MNRVFGFASLNDIDNVAESVKVAFANRHSEDSGEELQLIVSNNLLSGHINDQGSVLGCADLDDVSLVYLGWINTIEGGFPFGSPLDDPDKTAAFLIERYHARGASFLDGVEGAFVSILVDKESGKMFVGRDPSGGRRIFCRVDNGELAVASHLVDMQAILHERLEMDRSLEDFHLAYEFLPYDKTCYKGVEQLKAGQLLEWGATGISYHSIASKPVPAVEFDPNDEQSVLKTLTRVFRKAIEEQIPSTERVAVLLGGFDSALVASILVGMGKHVETFSFYHEDRSYNQAFTEELAGLLDIKHHWVPITADTIKDGLDSFADSFNQPVSQAHYPLNSKVACEAIREAGFTYCLTGDGCDGLFLGYPTVHLRAKIIHNLSRISWLLHPFFALAKIPCLEKWLGHTYRITRNVLRVLRRDMPARAHISACSLDDFSIGLLRTSKAPDQLKQSEEIIKELAEAVKGASELRLAYIGKGHVGLNRAKLEGCSAATGVVLNSPYLHPLMAEFARKLPENYSRPEKQDESNVTGKYALMRMAEQEEMLPVEMIHQKKMSPVTTPVDAWYQKELQSFMKERIKDLPFECDQSYIDSLFVNKLSERLFREHVGISRYTSNVLSMLVTYAGFTRDASSPDQG